MGVDIITPNVYEIDLRRQAPLVDDFNSSSNEPGEVGDHNWQRFDLAGSGSTLIASTLGAGLQSGVVGIQTGALANNASCLREGRRARLFSEFPVGSWISVRVHCPTITNMTWYVGLADAHNVVPDAAAVMDFVGFRYEVATDGNVYALVKTDGGGGSEDAVSLGAMSNSVWQTFTMQRTGATNYVATTPGGLSQVSMSGVTSNPADVEDFELVLGLETTDAVAKQLYVDFIMYVPNIDRR